MVDYKQEIRTIKKEAKKQELIEILKMILISAIVLVFAFTIGRKINAWVWLVLIILPEGFVLPHYKKKIDSIRYTANFEIEELAKMQIQERYK